MTNANLLNLYKQLTTLKQQYEQAYARMQTLAVDVQQGRAQQAEADHSRSKCLDIYKDYQSVLAAYQQAQEAVPAPTPAQQPSAPAQQTTNSLLPGIGMGEQNYSEQPTQPGQQSGNMFGQQPLYQNVDQPTQTEKQPENMFGQQPLYQNVDQPAQPGKQPGNMFGQQPLYQNNPGGTHINQVPAAQATPALSPAGKNQVARTGEGHINPMGYLMAFVGLLLASIPYMFFIWPGLLVSQWWAEKQTGQRVSKMRFFGQAVLSGFLTGGSALLCINVLGKVHVYFGMFAAFIVYVTIPVAIYRSASNYPANYSWKPTKLIAATAAIFLIAMVLTITTGLTLFNSAKHGTDSFITKQPQSGTNSNSTGNNTNSAVGATPAGKAVLAYWESAKTKNYQKSCQYYAPSYLKMIEGSTAAKCPKAMEKRAVTLYSGLNKPTSTIKITDATSPVDNSSQVTAAITNGDKTITGFFSVELVGGKWLIASETHSS